MDFPLGPRDGILFEGCNDCCCSPLAGSDPLCFPELEAPGSGVPILVVVAPCTLILGGAVGAEIVDVLAGPLSSAFFPATELILACLEVEREAGGGLFNRGEAGHCGVVSPEAGPALFGPARVGNFDTASVTAPPPPADRDGTLLADSAPWIAAAEGCDEKDWLCDAPGRLSLRIGEVFREDLGLGVTEGDDEDGNREAECCLRSVGVGIEDVEDAVL